MDKLILTVEFTRARAPSHDGGFIVVWADFTCRTSICGCARARAQMFLQTPSCAGMIIRTNSGNGLPGLGCGKRAAGWTGGGLAGLGSCSRGRPPERHCPAGSPPRSGTGFLAAAGWSPGRFHWDPSDQESRRRAAVS